jgi:hypothetical protein
LTDTTKELIINKVLKAKMAVFYFITLLASVIHIVQTTQIPLGESSVVEYECLGSPFDESFKELVEKSMQEFGVPGLSIAVVSRNNTYSTVS